MFCSNCGRPNPNGYRFCQSCGAPAVMPAQGRRPARKAGAGKIIGIISAAVVGLLLILLIGSAILSSIEDNRPVEITALAETPPEDCLSPLFQLTAGKNTARQPYTFTYKVSDLQLEDGEILTVGIGLEYITGDDGSEVLSYLPVEAEYEDGVASATFIPADYLDIQSEIRSSAVSSVNRRPVEGLCLGIYYTHTYMRPGNNEAPGSFRILTTRQDIKLGFVNEDVAEGILTDLENAYKYYTDQGYSFTQRTRWPMEIKMQWLGTDLYGAYYPTGSLNSSMISLNLRMFSHGNMGEGSNFIYNPGDNYPVVVHELGHFMQQCYAGANDCIWVDEACSMYHEWKTGGDIRTMMGEHLFRTLAGVYPSQSTANDGYGRMPLFRYLQEYVRPGFIRDLYVNSNEGYETAALWNNAITGLCGDPAGYISDYYNKLLTGKLGPYDARTVYQMVKKPEAGVNVGVLADIALPAAGADPQTLFSGGKDSVVLGTYNVTANRFGAQYLAINITSGELPLGTELSVIGYDTCDLNAYRISKDITYIPGSGYTVVLDDFVPNDPSSSTKGPFYLIQLIALHDDKNGQITPGKYTFSVILQKTGDTPPTPEASPDTPADIVSSAPYPDVTNPSPGVIEDDCADKMPEVAGVHITSVDNIPNARSGQISNAPYMHIDGFNIIGGRLFDPKFTPMTNEAFIYSNSGHCVIGETVGLELIATAREREHDSIAYNIIENQLTFTITFYDKSGNVIGTPQIIKSPDGATDHSISGSISAVVPEDAGSVNILGTFVHNYGAYGDYNSSSVAVMVDYTVCDCAGHPSAVEGDPLIMMPDSDDDDAEECAQFWKAMRGVWMHYNSAGEVEYFEFTGSGGGKSLVVGTVETGRSEPSQAITVSKYSETEFLVLYRYEGVDYKLYFEVSELGDGIVWYAAHNPFGYRAFDYTGKDMTEAEEYYNNYYAAG